VLGLERQRRAAIAPSVVEHVLPVALQERPRHFIRPADRALLAPVDEVAELDAAVLHRVHGEVHCAHPVDELDQVGPKATASFWVPGVAQRPRLLARPAAHTGGAGTYDASWPLRFRRRVLGASSSGSSGVA
jgi:hypothetical protein